MGMLRRRFPPLFGIFESIAQLFMKRPVYSGFDSPLGPDAATIFLWFLGRLKEGVPSSNRIFPRLGPKVSLNRLSVRFSAPLEHIAGDLQENANATNMSFSPFKKGLTSSAISKTYEISEI